MAANSLLLDLVRNSLMQTATATEKKMFGGVCFMVDGKMCVCVGDVYLMCRLTPDNYEHELQLPGVQQMVHGGRLMKGYVYVNEAVLNTQADVDSWVNKALGYNPAAWASKK
ncbi:TfoX/Sxy family protein [Mucilaginibacter roseus]|uniref:TfoX/Sxy family protein n=1 Tax=Mucilaginibacter roseus TaxID=1528868 RepID=A0ABS8TXA0_9SPHI|nr:TfoX/Sxy family protein [Mucilaginibacter roseus]MCD8739504.1 TfoX/Sxy family protein [Mucilaginibacter roseus]